MSDSISTTLTPEAAKSDAMSKAQRKAHEAFTKAASTAAKGLEAAGTAMVDALKAGCHAALSLAPRTYMTQVLTAAGMARSSADAAAAMAFVLWQAPEAQGIPAEGLRILARVAKGKDPAEVATAIRSAVRAARAKAHDRAEHMPMLPKSWRLHIRDLRPPVDNSLAGTSSWVNLVTKRDQQTPAGWIGAQAP